MSAGCFRDPTAAAKDYYKRTGIFPDHASGRHAQARWSSKHPWLPVAVLKAFEQSKADGAGALSDTSATKVTLPFVEEQLEGRARIDGRGLLVLWRRANRKMLETFLRHHHAQGLSSRLVAVEEMFHPATLESFKL